MMDAKWGSGDPTVSLPSGQYFAAYDDHNYVGFSSVNPTPSSYLSYSCGDDRGGNWPVVVGEWSMVVASAQQFDSDFWPTNSGSNLGFYQKWFSAQARVYEKQDGWIYWTWKTSGLGDARWDYQREWRPFTFFSFVSFLFLFSIAGLLFLLSVFLVLFYSLVVSGVKWNGVKHSTPPRAQIAGHKQTTRRQAGKSRQR